MPDRVSLFIDLDRCWGCRTCEVACALEKGLGPGRGRVRVTEVSDATGSVPSRFFIPVLCQHCEDAACIDACPVGAMRRDESGLVALDADACVACGACESACPYGAIATSPDTGRPEKCDFCVDRRAAGLLPACAQHCPGRAIRVDEFPAAAPNRAGKRGLSRGRVVYLSRVT